MNEAPIADERERRIFEAVMTLARSYRDDRERLVRRLSAVEHALDVLALRLELGPAASPAGTGAPGAPPPAPSRMPS